MPSITSLPSEIRHQIIHLAIDLWPEIAIVCSRVSRQWQAHVEMRTFSSLRLDQTRLETSRGILTSTRQSYVRNIYMNIDLPNYDVEKLLYERETPDEQHCNSEAFTDAVFLLFEYLNDWDQQRGISLSISASSPDDSKSRYRYREQRWDRSYLDIIDSPGRKLPNLLFITKFNTSIRRHRHFSPSACCNIAAHFPNVHTLGFVLPDNERRDTTRRIKTREDFASGIAILPQSVRHFKLNYTGGSPWDHSWTPPRLYYGDDTTPDPLSVALRKLARQLTTLELGGGDLIVISSEVFWPAIPSNFTALEDEPLSFPDLETLEIFASIASPSGDWLFIADPVRGNAGDVPDYDRIPDDNMQPGDKLHWFRVIPVSELVNPYYVAAARAMARMPRLTHLHLHLAAPRPCALDYKLSDDGPRATVEFCGSPPYDPPVEVKEAWREAARFRSKALDISLHDMGDLWTSNISTGV